MYLELHPTQLHTQGRDPVDVHLLLVRAAQDVKGFVHDLHFLHIIDGINRNLAKAAGRVICQKDKFIKHLEFCELKIFTVDVVGQLAGLMQVDNVGD